MRRGLVWTLAAIVTVASAVYQRMTGPTYPVRGRVSVEGRTVGYRLPRSAETTAPAEVRIPSENPRVEGYLQFRRNGSGDGWTQVPLARAEGALTASIPVQPAAGKVAYRVFLNLDGVEYPLGGEVPVVLRYKDPVSTPLLIVHVLVMFAGMLVSNAAGLAALGRRVDPRRMAVVAAALIFIGGLVLGPLVQKAAFGVYWSGFPLGGDLTDTKTLLTLAVWVVAVAASRKGRPARGWIVAAAAVTLAVYLIPHSLLGSELDYSKMG